MSYNTSIPTKDRTESPSDGVLPDWLMQGNLPVVPLMWLIGLNTALLVASNAAGAKMVGLPFGLSASATVLSYALSFAVTDTVSELYGKKSAQLVVRVAFLGLVASTLFFVVAIFAPPAIGWSDQVAYQTVLGATPRILAGGWTSYIVSQHLDVWLFHAIKKITGDKWLWLRNNASTAISQFVDTVIFMTIAFYGVFPLAGAIAGQYIVKVIIAAIDTPIVYLIVREARRRYESK